MSLSPFHLAIPVYDLAAARTFYGEVFGLEEGRSSTQWVDFDFYGHQLVIHEHPKTASQESVHSNPVDGHDVPVPHFGIILGWEEWEALAERLQGVMYRPDTINAVCLRLSDDFPESYAELLQVRHWLAEVLR